MANVTDIAPAAPKSSRSASRARRAAAGQAEAGVRELPARTNENTETQPVIENGTTETQTGRQLPERVESNNTTETAAPVPVVPTKLLILAAKNPKRNPSKAYTFFEMYYGTGENRNLTTVEDAFARGVRGKDLSWDRDRGHILLGDDVDAYLALESDADKIAWLEAKKFSPKMAGFIIETPAEAAPEAQPAAEGEQKTEEPAAQA